ncbi:MAG: acetyl-CoA hydrolase/transferase family protein, partial [Bacteroidota bacterium]
MSKRSSKIRIVQPEEALAPLQSGQAVYIHTAAAAPRQLVDAMTARKEDLHAVRVYHLHTEGEAPYVQPGCEEAFIARTFFTGKNLREAIGRGQADYIPIFLSEIPQLFHRGIIELDMALIHVSPPDKHGFCSLGVSVDATRAAILNAKLVIAQINPNMPRTHGDGLIHVQEIDMAIESDDPIHEHPPSDLTEVEKKIGNHVAELIEDGATLQMGIGSIPDAVLAALHSHRHLGIHTEMFSDGILPLISFFINSSFVGVISFPF